MRVRERLIWVWQRNGERRSVPKEIGQSQPASKMKRDEFWGPGDSRSGTQTRKTGRKTFLQASNIRVMEHVEALFCVSQNLFAVFCSFFFRAFVFYQSLLISICKIKKTFFVSKLLRANAIDRLSIHVTWLILKTFLFYFLFMQSQNCVNLTSLFTRIDIACRVFCSVYDSVIKRVITTLSCELSHVTFFRETRKNKFMDRNSGAEYTDKLADCEIDHLIRRDILARCF